MRVARQGIKRARPVISEHTDPRGKAYFWIGEQLINPHIEDGTDYHAIEQGFASITPRSDMTDHRALSLLDSWNSLPAAEEPVLSK
ncbi:MAG: hypothetical protein WKF84_01020 [Pyrinomonadaceae bacterium]